MFAQRISVRLLRMPHPSASEVVLSAGENASSKLGMSKFELWKNSARLLAMLASVGLCVSRVVCSGMTIHLLMLWQCPWPLSLLMM